MPELFSSVWSIILVVIGFGLIIFVHELGHFLVAKKVGIRVEVFSIGFGPELWSTTRGGTRYRLAIIPLGGYIKMAGENPEDRVEGDDGPPPEPVGDEYFMQSVGKRSMVIVAGSAMNFLFAFPLCILVYLIGFSMPGPYVGDVRPGSLGYEQGLRHGDKILEVNGKAVTSWGDFNQKRIFEAGDGKTLRLKIERAGETLREIRIKFDDSAGDLIEQGQALGFPNPAKVLDVRIDGIVPKTPAAKVLKDGDRIVAIGGQPVAQWNELTQIITASAGQELVLTVERDNAKQTMTITPVAMKQRGLRLGLETYQKPTIGFILKDSPAVAAGFKVGETITHIQTERQPEPVAVKSWQELFDHIFISDTTVAFTLTSPGSDPPVVRKVTQAAGLRITESIGLAPVPGLYAATDYPNMNVLKGDQLVTLDGMKIADWKPGSRLQQGFGRPIYWPSDLSQGVLLSTDSNDTREATFRRADGAVIEATVGYTEITSGMIGIVPYAEVVTIKPAFFDAIIMGLKRPFDLANKTIQTFPLLFSGKVSMKNLSGPVGILNMSYKSAQSGMGSLLLLMALICVSLAVINMMPVPILDGGHLLFLGIEKLKGSPLSDKVMIRAQFVGLFLLVSMMLFATKNDLFDFDFIRNLFT